MVIVGKPIPMIVIKTLANSWATSTRYHEDIRKMCLVGCHCFLDVEEAESETPTDSLAHYLACPLFWSLISSARRSPCTEWEITVPQRFCLDNPSVRRANLLAIGYRIYHCMKLGHSDIWDTAVQQNSYHLLHELVLALARHFADGLLLHHVR